MVLGETIVEGVGRVESSVQKHVQVGFGPSTDVGGKTVAELRFRNGEFSGQTIVLAVDQRCAQELIAALALALPRLG